MLRIAVVLLNLGGPDSLAAVRPFLFNLFSDKAIIALPQPWRAMLAWLIAKTRAPKARWIYTLMGGHSPIVQQTQMQAEALQQALNQRVAASADAEYKVFYCMRYWHPLSTQAVEAVKEWGPTEVILLPLYPQFSTSTTASSFQAWLDAATLVELKAKHTVICCYPQEKGFVQAYVSLVQETYHQAMAESKHLLGKPIKPRVLFSAHGLPLNRIKAGDPYQSQIEASVKSIVGELNIPDVDYKICYQSKVGWLQWLEPSTESQVILAGKEQIPVIIVPIAFVSEHSETKVELDIDYRKLAAKHKVPAYYRVATVSVNTDFINGLANLCLTRNSSPFRCAGRFKQCYYCG